MYIIEVEEIIERFKPSTSSSVRNTTFELDIPNNSSHVESVITDLVASISPIIRNLYKYLNLSVLVGEYCSNDFLDIIHRLSVTLDSIVIDIDTIQSDSLLDSTKDSLLDSTEDSSIQKYFYILTNAFLRPLLDCIKQYKILCTKLNKRINHPDELDLLLAYKQDKLTFINLEDFGLAWVIKEASYFIKFNIRLATIDFSLSSNDNVLRDLLLINHSVKSSGSSLSSIFIGKSSCLIYKILKRNDEDPKNYTYSIEFIDKELEISEFLNSSNNYKYFIENSNHHYSDEFHTIRNGPFFKKALVNLAKGINSSINFHAIMKFYKDVIPNYMEFSESINKFQIPTPSIFSEFDKRAYDISKHYFYNNILSLDLDILLSKESLKPIDPIDFFILISEKFNLIKSTQLELSVRNYFPYYKLLKTSIDFVYKLFDDFSIHKDVINRFIDLFHELEKELFLTTEWCNDRDFISFNCFYEDSRAPSTVDGYGELNLFLHSSILLPINYYRQKRENNELALRIRELSSLQMLKISVAIDKKEIEDAKVRVDSNERKNIEILSIFAAIVLFVTSNIKLFSYIDSFSQGLSFMLIMGYVIILFVLLIWLITREPGFYKEKDIFKHLNRIPTVHKYLIAIIFFSTIAAFFIAFNDSGTIKNDVSAKIKIHDTLLDSHKIILDKFDNTIQSQNSKIIELNVILKAQNKRIEELKSK